MTTAPDINSPDFVPLPLIDEDAVDPNDDVFRLSPSSISMYLQDPALYYYTKVAKRRQPKDLRLITGTALHAGLEHQLRVMAKDGTPPSLQDCLAVARKVWREETAAMMPIPGQPFEQTWLQLQNSLLPVAYESSLDLKPTAVEEYFDRQHPSGLFNVHGFVDVIHGVGVVADHKTAAKSPSIRNGKATMSNIHRLQVVIYAWLKSGGEYEVPVEIRTFVKKKAPCVVVASALITPEEMKRRLAMVESVFHAIKNKVFTPNFGHWSCGPGKCVFWNECHGDFGNGGDDGEENAGE